MSYIDRKTLKWLNDQRARLDLRPLTELPQGIRRNPSTCVLANGWEIGYRVRVRSEVLKVYDGGSQCVLAAICPWYVRCFIRGFDNGRRPQYVGYRTADTIAKFVPTVTPSWLDRLRMAKAIRRAEAEIAAERLEAARLRVEQEIAFAKTLADYLVDMADIATASEREDEFQRHIIRVAHAPRTEREVTLN